MKKNKYTVIGMMSGTSLDGIDLVEVVFWKDRQWYFDIRHAETIPYTTRWYHKLQHVTHLDAREIVCLDREYTTLLTDTIMAFIGRNKCSDIDAVCLHGHTVFHQPEKGLTLQIGTSADLAKQLGYKVVCDFRTQDIALGGQGAPLVPIGDRLLFSEYTYCLNLGGFANISFDDISGRRIAFDICPVNVVLNHYAARLGMVYDDEGKEAAKGKIDKSLLHELNHMEYYAISAPKSLGIEWVKGVFLPVVDSKPLEINTILRTLVAHMALQISEVIKGNQRVLVTGGGAYNRFLIQHINALVSSELILPPDEMVSFKEALIFGFLGVLRMRGEINCLSSATGAVKDHSSGKIFNA